MPSAGLLAQQQQHNTASPSSSLSPFPHHNNNKSVLPHHTATPPPPSAFVQQQQQPYQQQFGNGHTNGSAFPSVQTGTALPAVLEAVKKDSPFAERTTFCVVCASNNVSLPSFRIFFLTEHFADF